jgi:putative ABC transport system permease protein
MAIWRRIATWIRARREAAALREEIETHRSLTQAELERSGLSPREALAESRRRIGNVALALDDARDVWIVRWLDQLRQHLRYGVRGLRREPAFALTAVITLGLGTAAMTTVFSVTDGELWRPLPYPEPHRLMAIRSMGPHDADAIPLAELQDWRAAMPAFAELAAAGGEDSSVVRLDAAQSIDTARVTANYFTTLGRTAIAGRVFTADDAHGSNAVVLGSRGWQRAFDRRTDLIGKTIFVDDTPRVIVGVVESDDTRGVEDDLFLPIDERASAQPSNGTAAFRTIIGRLAPGATREVALGQMQAMLARRSQAERTRAGRTALITELSVFNRAQDGRLLYFFLGASILVLVLTIVNVAGLMLSRGLRRTPEFALRGALGGGARAIAVQLAVEAGLIAVPGCAAGLWLTRAAIGAVGHAIPPGVLVRGRHLVVDYRAAAVCAAVILIAMIGLALAPLGAARRANARDVTSGGSRASGLPSSGRTRERLLAVQMALTVLLLAAGALFAKSFTAETRVPLGFDASDGWAMDVSLSDARYENHALVLQYADALIARARAIPGVRDAVIANGSPLRSGFGVQLARHDAAADDDRPQIRAVYRAVSPRYFRAIATPITLGREFEDSDGGGATRVAIVNEHFVRSVLGGANPIGMEIEIKRARTPQVRPGVVTIVGVAANIKELGINEAGIADIYVPFAQTDTTGIELIVRGRGSDETMPAQLRRAAAEADPAIPVYGIAALGRRVAVALQRDRFNVAVAAGFSIVALLIAGIGIYGAMAYAAVTRAREFGVRLALGASPTQLLGRALWRAARLGFIGAALGVVAALGAAASIGDALYTVPGKQNGLLYNVRTTDPVALGAAAAGVIVIALLSGAIPARRLSRIDPVKTLRAE